MKVVRSRLWVWMVCFLVSLSVEACVQIHYKPDIPYVGLLTDEYLQDEFHFSKAQLDLVKEARRHRAETRNQTPGMKPYQEKLFATLSSIQKRRLTELSIQVHMPNALLSDYLLAKLGLSSDQVSKLETLLQSYIGPDWLPGEVEAHEKINDPKYDDADRLRAAAIWRDANKRQWRTHEKRLAERSAKAYSVLTPSQTSSLKTLLGKEFPVRWSYLDLRSSMKTLLFDRRVQAGIGFSLAESNAFQDGIDRIVNSPDPYNQTQNAFLDNQLASMTPDRLSRLQQVTIQVIGARAISCRLAAESLHISTSLRAALVRDFYDLMCDETYDLFAVEMKWRGKEPKESKPGMEGAYERQRFELTKQQELTAVRNAIEVRREKVLTARLSVEQMKRWRALQGRLFQDKMRVRASYPDSYMSSWA